MKIEAIDVLAGQKAAFEAPPAERNDVYRERVDEPTRTLWEPMMGFMSSYAGSGNGGPPPGAAAIGFHGVGGDGEAALDALGRFEAAGSFDESREALGRAAEALDPEGRGISLDPVTFVLALANPADPADRNRGYTGFGCQTGHAVVLAWPNEYNLPRLSAIAVHELHHNVRLAFEPWTAGTTVGQYVVMEGLAEAFAAEVVGEERLGPWPKALSEEQLEEVRSVFREGLEVAGFDEIRGYIFGDWAATQFGYTPQGLPDFAGYAVGYRVVSEYLRRSGLSAAEATYAPWRKIVEGSRFL